MKNYIKTQKNNKLKEKKSKKNGKISFVVISLCIGFFIGLLQDVYLKDFSILKFGFNNPLDYIFETSGFLLVFILGFIVHIIIHEGGHLIFGLISRYSFVSFRVGSFMIIKDSEKLRLKRFNIPGTAGQCLMMPPDLKDGKFPFILYNFGGVIMNLIISILGISFTIFLNGVLFPYNGTLDAILILSGIAGILVVLTNGIPMKIGGIANDGYNALSMIKDENARKGFYIQLRVNGLQSQGIRIKDMDLEMFYLNDNVDLSNPLNTSMRLMEYNWYLDNMDLENARKTINTLIPYFNRLVPIYRYEINCERIFLELVGDCDKNFIDRLYDKSLKKYIKAAKFMISKKRLLMAYEAYYNKDEIKALGYYEEIKQLAEKYPVKGDSDMELMIANHIVEDINKSIPKI